MNFVYNPLEGKFDMIRAIPIKRGIAQGQMSFWDNTLNKWVHTETSELFWDDTNKRVGIGTDSPNTACHVIGEIKENNRELLRYNLLLS